MKYASILPAALICGASFAFCGCAHRLPNIRASELHQSISFPGFSSSADASGVNITDKTLKAKDASWRIAVLGVAVTTLAKDYEQKRTPAEIAADSKP